MQPNDIADQAKSIAVAEARENELLVQLSAAPIVEVLGVVEPKGVTGWGHADGTWTLCFSFHAWRIANAELCTQQLAIRRRVLLDELPKFREFVVPYTVLRIRARVIVKSCLGNPQASIEEVVGPDTSDAELMDQADLLQQPVTFVDPVFGTFTLDRRVNWFAANTVWKSDPVSLNLLATEPADLQNALKTAHSLWAAQDSWNHRVRAYAVQSLLSVKNDFWLDETETRLTADQFNNRMTLESITVSPNGSFDFWHNDGDLFRGHSIEVRGNLTDGPTDADIPG